VKTVGFEAAFRRRGLRKQDLKDALGNPHHTLIFADTPTPIPNSTTERSGLQRASGGKRKNDTVRFYQDKFVAHLAELNEMTPPVLDLLTKSIWYYHAHRH